MPLLATLGLLLLGMIILAVGAMVVLGTLGMVLFSSIFMSIGPMSVLGGMGGSIMTKTMGAIGPMSTLGTLGAAIFAVALLAANDYVNSSRAQTDVQNLVGATSLPADVPKPYNYGQPGEQIGAGFHASELANGRWQKPFEDLYNSLGGSGQLIPGLATGGQVLKTGWVNMHAGEVAADRGDLLSSIKEAVSSSGGGDVTVVIPGSAIANAIDNRIDYYYRTKVANRR
jgi:hypothetical protein